MEVNGVENRPGKTTEEIVNEIPERPVNGIEEIEMYVNTILNSLPIIDRNAWREEMLSMVVEIPKEPTPEPPNKGKDNVIQFLVFYPNNYSGMDDKINGEVDPIKYLINGLGAQKKYVPNAKNDIQDLQTDVSKNFTWSGKRVGGYEM